MRVIYTVVCKMTSYRLTYFNARGVTETIRFILAQAGVQYEDKRIPFQGEEWVELKPTAPFGTLPILEEDGRKIGGNAPIARYLAEKFGLSGSNEYDNAVLASIMDAVLDFVRRAYTPAFEKDEARKAELKKELQETHIPKILGNLKKFAVGNNCKDGWLYGPKVTYADFAGYIALDVILQNDPNVLDRYPALKKLRTSVENLPNIAKWLQDRPKTDY